MESFQMDLMVKATYGEGFNKTLSAVVNRMVWEIAEFAGGRSITRTKGLSMPRLNQLVKI
jgi:hypothetical protein